MSHLPPDLRRRLTPSKPADPSNEIEPQKTPGKMKEAAPEPAGVDAIDIVVLVVVAAALRFWRLHDPDSVVFDEYHFGKFTNW